MKVPLSEAERAELTLLVQELDAEESAYLAAAAKRLRREREAVEIQNRRLEVLARRREALVRRLGGFLTEAGAERRAIECELAAVLSGSRGSETER